MHSGKRKRTNKKLKEPDDIDKNVTDPIEMHKWQEKHKRHMNKAEEFDGGKKKLHTSVLGQCTQPMKNESQAVNEFEEMDDEQDPMKLIENI